MDNLNKTVSFILGLVVVLVFLAIITGRLNLKSKIPALGGKVTPTPTPTVKASNKKTNITTTSGGTQQNPEYNQYTVVKGGVPNTIPSTGSPTLLLPILLSGLGGGLLLKKSTKN